MIEFAQLPQSTTLSDFYDIGAVIGEGSFGIVRRAICKTTRICVAIKEHKPSPKHPSRTPRDVLRELLVHSTCESPYIVKLLKVVTNIESTSIYLIYEYLDYDLYQLIRSFTCPTLHAKDMPAPTDKSSSTSTPTWATPSPSTQNKYAGKMPLEMIRSVMWQVLNGLYEMHEQHLLHRDLKPANVLVKDLFTRCAVAEVRADDGATCTVSTPATAAAPMVAASLGHASVHKRVHARPRSSSSSFSTSTRPLPHPSSSSAHSLPPPSEPEPTMQQPALVVDESVVLKVRMTSEERRGKTKGGRGEEAMEAEAEGKRGDVNGRSDVTRASTGKAKEEGGGRERREGEDEQESHEKDVREEACINTDGGRDVHDTKRRKIEKIGQVIQDQKCQQASPLLETPLSKNSNSQHSSALTPNSLSTCVCSLPSCFKHTTVMREYPADSLEYTVYADVLYQQHSPAVPLRYVRLRTRDAREMRDYSRANASFMAESSRHSASSVLPAALASASASFSFSPASASSVSSLASSASSSSASSASLPPDRLSFPLLRVLERHGINTSSTIRVTTHVNLCPVPCKYSLDPAPASAPTHPHAPTSAPAFASSSSSAPALVHEHPGARASIPAPVGSSHPTGCVMSGGGGAERDVNAAERGASGTSGGSEESGPEDGACHAYSTPSSPPLPSSSSSSSSSVLSLSTAPPSLPYLEHGSVVLADVGMALSAREGVVEPVKQLEGNVMTLWYRAPELILEAASYTNKIDIWGAGCIFLECLTLSCPFQGKEIKHEYQRSQFQAICGILGNPEFKNPGSLRHSRWYVKAMQELKPSLTRDILYDKVSHVLSGTERDICYDLLKKMLSFDPERRISAIEALQHPFFSPCRAFYTSPYLRTIYLNGKKDFPISLPLPDPNNMFCIAVISDRKSGKCGSGKSTNNEKPQESEIWAYVPIKFRNNRYLRERELRVEK